MYIASLILGILSVLFSWVPILNIILALITLIISIIAISRKKQDKTGRGMGITGVILGSVAIIISIVFYIAVISLISHIPNIFEKVINEIKEEIDINEITSYLEAETLLQSKYAQLAIKNKDKAYTGYINSSTEEYTEKFSGIEVDEFYEYYLRSNGYDCDINVDIFGEPSIEY